MDSNNFDRLSGKLANATSRRQALKLIAGGLAGGVLAAKGTSIAAQRPEQGGTAELFDVDGVLLGTVSGLLATLDRATGAIDISGTFADLGGAVTEFTTSLLDGSSGTCDILSLVLGPLELNILGLDVFLDTVILEIVAVPGPGNLLGNLLCAVAGLLDGGASGNALVTLLNRLFGLLG